MNGKELSKEDIGKGLVADTLEALSGDRLIFTAGTVERGTHWDFRSATLTLEDGRELRLHISTPVKADA